MNVETEKEDGCAYFFDSGGPIIFQNYDSDFVKQFSTESEFLKYKNWYLKINEMSNSSCMDLSTIILI